MDLHDDSVSPRAKLAVVFGTSALILVLQLVHARILAVQFWHHVVYFVMTMGFLGFAASGTCLSVSRRVSALSDRAFFAWCLGGLALGILASRLVLAILPNTAFAFLQLGSFIPLSLAHTALMIPYFCGGLVVGGALRREAGRASVLYLASLAGSAAGCLLFVALITPLGALGLLALLFAAAAAAGLRFAQARRPQLALALWGVALGTAVVSLLPVDPDRGKLYWRYDTANVEFSEWNAISRIDVVADGHDPAVKRVLIDGDAQAPMFLDTSSHPAVIDTALRAVVYALRPAERIRRVLVIGAGGGADVLTAKRAGARQVDAVEINPTTVRLMQGPYADFTNRLVTGDGVRLHNEDGRSFAARAEHRYDTIVLFAVDSLAASATGAYVLVENYLYTSEAFKRYWDILTDRGALQIGRWEYPAAPREAFRVFTQASEVLAASGIRDPGRHLAVIGSTADVEAPFADVIVTRQPLTRADVADLKRFSDAEKLLLIYAHPSVAPPPPDPNVFYRFAQAQAEGRAAGFYAGYRFNVRPVTDDSPFFFSYRRWSDILPGAGAKSVEYYDNLIGAKPLILLVLLIVQATALVVALVVWPLVRSRRGAASLGPGNGFLLVFFALLGIGFMFIEIPLIQRFVLVLGHPTYSISVTLAGILIGAGAGSYLSGSGRFQPTARVGLAAAGLILAIAFLHFGAPGLARQMLTWPFVARLAGVGLVAGAFGLLMGIPFPTAVAALAGEPHVVSLAWAVNGGTTVVASIVAIPMAMTWGFSRVLFAAGACYFGAALVFAWSQFRKPSPASSARPAAWASVEENQTSKPDRPRIHVR